jgi:hypothetical protein
VIWKKYKKGIKKNKKKDMGNLRSKYTDEEWEKLEKKAIKIDPKLGIDYPTAKKIQEDIFLFGQVITYFNVEPSSDKNEQD